jgi:hypothetical protein
MKKYVIFTDGGYTEDNDGNVVENMQILDMVDANSFEEAKEKFYEEGNQFHIGFEDSNIKIAEITQTKDMEEI